MKIIIIGAGQVGATLAENLVGEMNEITVIDSDHDTLRHLQDRLDLRVVNGVGSHPDVLKKAGAEDADMLIAVTSSDESNMMACQVAYLKRRLKSLGCALNNTLFIKNNYLSTKMYQLIT